MPVNQRIWTLEDGYKELNTIRLNFEYDLENLIETRPEVIDDNLMLIGRQVITSNQGRIDLLGINLEGSLIIIELKRDKTPRDVIAQTLDYASWIVDLSSDDISKLYQKYKGNDPNASLSKDYKTKFNKELEEEAINSSHQLIIVASEMDSSTERITNYLNRYSIPVNILFFSIFEFEGKRLLSRTWFIDPQETIENTTPPSEKAPWNEEFYCSFGHDDNRSWNDAVKYGFVSAGFGQWYTKTLKMLSIGDRIWVNIPHTGYVGVGTVSTECLIAKNQKFELFENKTIFELNTEGKYLADFKDDVEKSEYIVLVKWEKTVSLEQAVSEIGMFGNQNTICRPTSQKWLFSMKILKSRWNIQ
ncbi:endonuclease NucS domain-containing protein [Leptospira sp. 'Mane']|uniref:endonuclease NucS domain-containing protein n=1 Tax=Leptospira sp. 'Mane' TaxID=3387407 RepID=UPI00398AB04A